MNNSDINNGSVSNDTNQQTNNQTNNNVFVNPNDQNQSSISNDQTPTSLPPSVAPPTIGNVEELKLDEEDGKVLRLNDKTEEQVQVEDSNTVKVEEEVKEEKKEDLLENKKMEQVQIEYHPPGKGKIIAMILLFVAILVSVIFLPQISELLSSFSNSKAPVNEGAIQNGTMSCDLETNDENYDLIYANVFKFKNRQITSLDYTLTTRGDKTIDSTALETMYNNCKSLAAKLNEGSYGVEVSCDMYDGTVTVDETFDYSLYQRDAVLEMFNGYSLELADYEANQNVSDIQETLTTKGYSCTVTSEEE